MSPTTKNEMKWLGYDETFIKARPVSGLLMASCLIILSLELAYQGGFKGIIALGVFFYGQKLAHILGK